MSPAPQVLDVTRAGEIDRAHDGGRHLALLVDQEV